MPAPDQDRRRVVIEAVTPEIDGGRFPIKRTVGEEVVVEADIFTDGHDALSAVLLHRHAGETTWRQAPLEELVNDRWRGRFAVDRLGRHLYTVRAWVDHFGTWRRDLEKKVEAGLDVTVDLQAGATTVADAAGRASDEHAAALRSLGRALVDPGTGRQAQVEAAFDRHLADLMAAHPEPDEATTYPRELEVAVDRERARFSAWYELFPRSCVENLAGAAHATLADCGSRLEYVAGMGFDVVYLPPIHPTGRSHRKGPNNVTTASPEDPGSPWAIGSEAGGHDSVEPRLGTLADVRAFIARAEQLNLEVALDLAYQCSPDHPWVKEHPDWFHRRPDGTVRYAENPPKKYEDIYPLNFDTPDWRALWQELARIVFFWIEQGVRIFRVDNPHTKPFAFWEWLIGTVKAEHPDVIFLSEAFTRPKVMYRLAKLGFTQSYTYFAWRNTRWELTEYFTELTDTQAAEFFRPNLWPNTPDILTEYLQTGGRPAFLIRLVLAATLGASYGIYGPAFELLQNQPREPGSEEYLDSEKYQVRRWDLDRRDSLRPVITLINRARRDNRALQSDRGLRFHRVDNEQLICYSKQTEDGENVVIVVVNLDPYHTHHGWVDLDLRALGLDPEHPFQVHDLLSGAHYLWQGPHNYVELDPHTLPAHILRVRRHVRTEQDFSYYM
ncbi:MAG: alpha-1,4-glucan--maltose-1-phosphate maltosyltransferase [Thermoleophilia bacterium]|nr:alpha-1,4-glucan--maltose-1-phosphate maltosyltransferase [Thermoleophilia bacterium]